MAAETDPEYVPQIEYVPASELRIGVIQPMPDLEPEELEALRADIAESGVQVPVDVIREVGSWLVVDGNNRAAIAAELRQNVPIRPVPGLKMSDAIRYALRVNVARRHLTSKQKRELIAAELRHDRSRSDAAIARLLGVSDKTVAAVRARNLGISEVSKSAGGRPHRDGTPARRTERTPATPRQIGRSVATPDAAQGQPWKDFSDGQAAQLTPINGADPAPVEVIRPENPITPEQPPEPVETELQTLRAERDGVRTWQAGAAETEVALEATIAGLEQQVAERDEQIARLEATKSASDGIAEADRRRAADELAQQRIRELARDVRTLEGENRAYDEALAGTRSRIGQQDAEIAALRQEISDLNEELRAAREAAVDASPAASAGPAPELTEALRVIEELRVGLATMTGRYEAFAAADADRPEDDPARGYRSLAADMAHWLDVVHPDWQAAFDGPQPDGGAPPAADVHEVQQVQRRRWRRS